MQKKIIYTFPIFSFCNNFILYALFAPIGGDTLEGWIKIHRSIQDHWIYKEKRIFSKYEAWLDMIMMANHKANKFLLGNELIEVSRGQFITSELKLMDKWGWSKTKLRNFIKTLEKDGMISKKSDKKKTTITIVNYSDWQSQETTERPQEDHKKTTERPQEDTNKNEKNEKNEKNINNNKDFKSVFDYYLSLDLVKHRAYTKDMQKAITKAVKDNKYDIEYCKTLLDRHEKVVEITKNTEYPVKARGFAEFFGQKVFKATHLICSEYEEGGKYYEQYLKMSKPKNGLFKRGEDIGASNKYNREHDQYEKVKSLKLGG